MEFKTKHNMIRELVPFFFVLRTFFIKVTLLAFGLFLVLWISGVIYGSIYYAFIPAQTYLLPVNFAFEPCPLDSDKDRCSFLEATVDFEKNEILLLSDQMYSISLDMTIPADQTNQNVGLFMVCLSLESSHSQQMKPKICKSAILPFRTSIYRIIWSLIPFQNYGCEEILNIEFLDNFKDDIHSPIFRGNIEIQSRHLSVSNSYLRVHTNFYGLQYLMYNYPRISGILGITFICICLCSLLLLIFGQTVDPVTSSDFDASKKELHEKLKNCPNFEKVIKKVNSMKDVKFHEKDSKNDSILPKQRLVNFHED